MSSYVKYCKAQAVECARRAKLASSPELAAERRSLGLRWLKLAEKAKATPLGRPREVESAALGVLVILAGMVAIVTAFRSTGETP